MAGQCDHGAATATTTVSQFQFPLLDESGYPKITPAKSRPVSNLCIDASDPIVFQGFYMDDPKEKMYKLSADKLQKSLLK